uniref:Putative translation initiation factor 5a n=1 Tax=Ixodes ricinus TaxID=34613 RepID=A0A0K8R580_IXORI
MYFSERRGVHWSDRSCFVFLFLPRPRPSPPSARLVSVSSLEQRVVRGEVTVNHSSLSCLSLLVGVLVSDDALRAHSTHHRHNHTGVLFGELFADLLTQFPFWQLEVVTGVS